MTPKEITVIAMDFIGWACNPSEFPFEHNFKDEDLKAGKIVFNKTNGCWVLERPTKGIIQGDLFIPYPGQSVQYSIAVPKCGYFNKPD